MIIKKRRLANHLLKAVLWFIFWVKVPVFAGSLPVTVPEGFKEIAHFSIDCLLTVDDLQHAVKNGDANGLRLDLNGIRTLLDGTVIKPGDTFSGDIYMGPYPFEAREVSYTYKRFRTEVSIINGKAVLPVGYFLSGIRNSEDWKTQGRLVLRFKLYLQTEDTLRFLGLYDTFIGFKRVEGPDGSLKYVKQTAVIEGPMVNLVMSDDPTTMAISFKTSEKTAAKVVLNDGRSFTSGEPVKKHEIKITGLEPAKAYAYHIEFETVKTKSHTFRTAPKPGEGEVIFAYAGDSREGYGGGMSDFMGVNYNIMERCANLAYRLGTDLFLFGGDLVNGFTTSPGDFRTQVHGWKQAMAGFWNHCPVYPCIGNHESLLRIFVNDKKEGLGLDRWPYETESVEAVFADELVNPRNGPAVSHPGRPAYKENVYSFQYGPVKFIAFNNNYWVGYVLGARKDPAKTGGAPEGYILDDQMQWIKKELDSAEKDPAVKYVIMFAQEPVFPNGGHLSDSMWYYGNNNVRAYTYDPASNKPIAEKKGIIEVRNRLITMVSQNKKVAAVLGCDEHSYHKVLIDKNVPVGVPALDDMDGSGWVCKKGGSCSPLKSLKYPVWYLVCGGAGAPYYAEEPTPWNIYWKNYTGTYPNHTSRRGCSYYSSQENIFIFKADREKISLEVYSAYGEIVDTIGNLLEVKKNL